MKEGTFDIAPVTILFPKPDALPIVDPVVGRLLAAVLAHGRGFAQLVIAFGCHLLLGRRERIVGTRGVVRPVRRTFYPTGAAVAAGFRLRFCPKVRH